MSKVGNMHLNSNINNMNVNRDNRNTEIEDASLKKRTFQVIVDFICIVIVFVTYCLIYSFVNPAERGFYCDDTSIFYPFRNDTIQPWVVVLYATAVPMLAILLVELYNTKLYWCQKEKYYRPLRIFLICVSHAISLFLLGIGFTLLITEIGKRWVGRLRPHFIDVCKPNFTSINCITNKGANVIYNIIQTNGSFCTGDANQIKQARMSFPSGHSSYACFTMLFLIVYLEARFHSLRFRFIKAIIQCLAFIAAYLTVTSRVNDHQHHVTDVIASSLLGIVVALFMTLAVGRVLWQYHPPTVWYDYDIKFS